MASHHEQAAARALCRQAHLQPHARAEARGAPGRPARVRCCSSCRSTPRDACTMTSASSSMACSNPGRCPRVPPRIPWTSAWRSQVEDHPFDYGSFEGVIPAKQYGAGNVIVWDCGVYSPDEGQQYAFGDRALAEQRVRAELAAGKLSFFLCGEKLKGSYTLVRTAQQQPVAADQAQGSLRARATICWRAIAPCSPAPSLEEVAPRNGDAAACRRRAWRPPAPRRHAPATETDARGERRIAAARIRSGATSRSSTVTASSPSSRTATVRLQSRRGLDLTARSFPSSPRSSPHSRASQLVLDGEIVALDPTGAPPSTPCRIGRS